MKFLSGSRPGRWLVWLVYRALDKPLPVPHAAEWMMIPEHSVEQVLETGALESLYPQDVLEAARRMDRQRREHDERYSGGEATMPHEKMRAIVTRGHGGPKVLRREEVQRPEARGKKMLIEVRAAGVNPVDWRLRRGELRPLSALMPRRVPGRDVAGVVAAVGDEVRGFEVGDRVFAMLDGVSGGGYAEYAVAGEDAVAAMPKNLSFEEAAAAPLAALTAVQAIRDALREVVRNAPHACDTGELARRKVLVNGASGGVGTFAVQFAKISGAEVTAVCSAGNAALAGELGADHVVDYEEEDFARHEEWYDVIFDVVGNRSFGACRRALRFAGVYVTTEPGPRNFLSQVATSSAHKKARVVLVKPSGEDLSLLKQLFETGRLRVVLDSVYPLEEAAEAHAHGEAGHARGKIVLRVDR